MSGAPTRKILISHSAADQMAAELLKSCLVSLSHERISVWYSSDRSTAGGMAVGGQWFQQLQEVLRESEVIVALVTPNSVNSPWIYFESGSVVNRDYSSVVPVTLGLPLDRVPMPLAGYQGYDLARLEALKEFVAKLFAQLALPLNMEVTSPYLELQWKKLSALRLEKPTEAELRDGPSELSQVSQLIERRFVDLFNALQGKAPEVSFDIQVDVIRGDETLKEFAVAIRSGDKVSDVLHNIEFDMFNVTGAVTYLKDWILEERGSGQRLIVSEVDDRIPADAMFRPGAVYVAHLLSEPLPLLRMIERRV
ncbi:MAG: toll/interleukin-1 receptor domain-containing protein [Caulobacterales bacterium]